MIVLTPAGAALCAALAVNPCTWSTLVVAAFDKRSPPEHRYEFSVGCNDSNPALIFCGSGYDCIVAGTYITPRGEPWFIRICREGPMS